MTANFKDVKVPTFAKPLRPMASARGVAGATGLEPAASGVTGRRSNQLSYAPEGSAGLNGRPPSSQELPGLPAKGREAG